MVQKNGILLNLMRLANVSMFVSTLDVSLCFLCLSPSLSFSGKEAQMGPISVPSRPNSHRHPLVPIP